MCWKTFNIDNVLNSVIFSIFRTRFVTNSMGGGRGREEMIIVEQNRCSTILLSKTILSSGRDLNVHPWGGGKQMLFPVRPLGRGGEGGESVWSNGIEIKRCTLPVWRTAAVVLRFGTYNVISKPRDQLVLPDSGVFSAAHPPPTVIASRLLKHFPF